jgi:hypothetical protein
MVAAVEPKLQAVEKLKAGLVDDCRLVGSAFAAKEDCGGEHTLEPLDHAAIMGAVLRQAKELQDLGRAPKANRAALLEDSEGGDPDGNQAVLAVRQTEARVGSDFEREPAVVPRVDELAAGGSAQRNTAEYEGPGVVAKLLPAGIALLADELDGFELLEASSADSNGGRRMRTGENDTAAGAVLALAWLSTCREPLFQNCSKSL